MFTVRHRSGGSAPWRSMFSAGALFLSLCAAGLYPASAAPAAAHVAAIHVPELVATAKPLGPIAATPAMTVEFVLPLRNQARLTDELNRIADPKDPMYGHYLTSQQFADAFGPSLADVNAIAQFAKSKGLSLKDVSGNRTLIKVTGSSSAIENAFGVRLNNYQTVDGRVFFAPDREPAFPTDIAHRIVGLTGLDNARVFTPSSHMLPKVPTLGSLPAFAQPLDGEQPQDVIGTGPTIAGFSTLAPNDIRSIYTIPAVSSPGSGQTLAVFELDGYTASDITAYDNHYYPSLAAVPLQNVLVDGFDGSAGSGAGEVTLDLQMFVALCPYATKIICYEAPNDTTGDEEEYARIASDNLASVVSSSWGSSESGSSPDAEATSENQSFQQMARQGQSMFDASGDSGAYANQTDSSPGTLSVQDPGSQPYATAVGGTLMNDSSSEAYVSESAWSAPGDTNRGISGTGSGGGISAWWPIPPYQNGFANTSNKGSTTQRNVPDVSLFGDFDEGYYSIYSSADGGFSGSNGTSAAAPLWAAYVALVNQGRASHGSPKIGFINPAVYSLASNTTTYNNDFHDVKDGTTNLYYPAVTGYDLATGIGSPKGTTLYNDLVAYGVSSTPTITSFTPTSGAVGTSVTITGTNFTGATAVKFNTTTATTFHVASATSITATVPTGATTGKISVTTASGTAMSSANFTVTTAGVPTITSIAPTSGPVGTVVTITGTNLASVTKIRFHNAYATTYSVNGAGTQVAVTVPTGAGTGTITVTTSAGAVSSSQTFTVTTTFSAPTITSFTPTSGPVGTVVTITGTHLSAASAVKFHGTSATTFSVTADTQITATVPTGTTTGTIAVTTPGGTATSSASFTVTTTGVPTITSIAPTSGPVGTVVTITGTNLGSVTKIRFHNAYATTYSVNGAGTQIMVTVPTGAGTGTITVTTSAGAVSSSQTFTVTTGPVITLTGFAASPTTVAPGAVFGLGAVISSAAPAGGVSVTLTQNGTAQSPIVIAAGQTSGGVSYTAGSTPTTYTFSASYGGATLTATVTVAAATPTITSIAPTSGPVGTVVTITGTNLGGVTKIRFHNAYATTYSANGAGTQLTVTVPTGAGTGTITVTTSAGAVTSSQTFTVTTGTAALSSLVCSPSTVQESANFTVTATLTAPAPAGGASVSLSLSGTTEPAIAIAAGQTSGSVTYTSGTTPGTYTFTASYGGATKTASFTVVAPNGTLINFYFSPSTVAGGSTTTGYIVFSVPLTSAVTVTVLSVDGYDASYTCSPAGGATTYTFSATPNQTSSTYTDTFTAYGPNNSVSTDLTVTAP